VAVRPIIVCGACKSPLAPGDKFCTQCGAEIEWSGVPVEETQSADEGAPGIIVCPSCGVSNDASNQKCSGCGSPLSATTVPGSVGSKKKSHSGKGQAKSGSGSKFQSWQILVGLATIAIAVFLVIGELRNSPKELGADTGTQPNTPSVSPTLISDIQTFEAEANANPNDAEAQLRLAHALHDAKFLPRAIEAYKRYLRLKPKDSDALVDMGICYYESGDSPTAIKDMKLALKYDPEHQMALYNLGIVTLNMGDLKTSNEWFRKSIAADPNTDVAKRAGQLVAQHSLSPQ
jgi:Double zinc ribbon/Tetratricopeptide repeat